MIYNMNSMILLFVIFVAMVSSIGASADQSLSSRTASTILKPPAIGNIKEAFGLGRNDISKKENSRHKPTQYSTASITRAKTILSDGIDMGFSFEKVLPSRKSIISMANRLKRASKDAGKEFIHCSNYIISAKDNYQRIDRTIEVIINHKAAVAVAAVGAYGLYTRALPDVNKRAADVIQNSQKIEIEKWGRRAGY